MHQSTPAVNIPRATPGDSLVLFAQPPIKNGRKTLIFCLRQLRLSPGPILGGVFESYSGTGVGGGGF